MSEQKRIPDYETGRIIKECRCLLCAKEWWPRTPERPLICPNCKSARWNKGRRGATKEPKKTA